MQEKLQTHIANGVQGRNRILSVLGPAELSLLQPHIKDIQFAQGAVLQEQSEPIEQVYFPHSGMISLVAVMNDGEKSIETATVGREGTVAGRCCAALADELRRDESEAARTVRSARMASLSIRPERVRVLDGVAATAGSGNGHGGALNHWPATVVDVIHQGDHWRLVAQLAGADHNAAPWIVKLPAGSAQAGHAALAALAPGTAVTLGFAPEDAWVF